MSSRIRYQKSLWLPIVADEADLASTTFQAVVAAIAAANSEETRQSLEMALQSPCTV